MAPKELFWGKRHFVVIAAVASISQGRCWIFMAPKELFWGKRQFVVIAWQAFRTGDVEYSWAPKELFWGKRHFVVIAWQAFRKGDVEYQHVGLVADQVLTIALAEACEVSLRC